MVNFNTFGLGVKGDERDLPLPIGDPDKAAEGIPSRKGKEGRALLNKKVTLLLDEDSLYAIVRRCCTAGPSILVLHPLKRKLSSIEHRFLVKTLQV